MSADAGLAQWVEEGVQRHARWRSESGWPPPARVQPADDRIAADHAYRLVCEGTALLWRGDWHNARQLLAALARRIDRKPRRAAASRAAGPGEDPALAFHRHRQAQGRRARLLAMLLVELAPDRRIDLGRAPDLRPALEEAWGPHDATEPTLVAMRELLGVVGAHEWRRRGVEIAALGAPPDNRIHPHYGVYSPVRGEYLDLVAQAPLPPDRSLAWDIGTGTGVIAAVLARRGVRHVVATDISERALACAADNLQRLRVADRVSLLRADLFPAGHAPLIVCNPPWLPARPTSGLEHAVYDEGGSMLRGFLAGVRERLAPGGEAWLLMSDLAEHLGLRREGELQALFAAGGLVVREQLVTRPRHPKASDQDDPLAAARMRERTSLWRLGPAAAAY